MLCLLHRLFLLPDTFRSLACLENSYSCNKAPLSSYFFVVFLDSARQIVWFSSVLSLRLVSIHSIIFVSLFFKQTSPL